MKARRLISSRPQIDTLDIDPQSGATYPYTIA
jgi:hypothetical protein